jgi:hypothetical protein
MEASSQLHAPAGLPQEKSPLYPPYRRLCETQSRSGYGVKEKIPSLRRESNLIVQSSNLARSHSMYRLSYAGSSFHGSDESNIWILNYWNSLTNN